MKRLKSKTKAMKSNVARLASLVACLLPAAAFAASNDAAITNSVPTALLRPVTLKDENGKPEMDLVDPFRRQGADDGAGESAEPSEDGLLRTSLGEISSEFRILAITVPADTNATRTALIQFYTSDEPVLVHEGDLVRVDRLGANRRAGKSSQRRARTAANVAGAGGLADLDLEEQLKKYVFYVNVKHIDSTFIEVYHNKKRPDETIRLNW